jgi:hypothetical protein
VQFLVQRQPLAQQAPLFQRIVQNCRRQNITVRPRTEQPFLSIDQFVVGGDVFQQQFRAAGTFGLSSCGHEPIMRVAQKPIKVLWVQSAYQTSWFGPLPFVGCLTLAGA